MSMRSRRRSAMSTAIQAEQSARNSQAALRSTENQPLDAAAALGEPKPILFDSSCGEPIAWGYGPFPAPTPNIPGETYRHYATLGAPYYYITRSLTRRDAVALYGPIVDEERGPKGGFRSITFGTKKFVCRWLNRH